jgi:hypothetical protein
VFLSSCTGRCKYWGFDYGTHKYYHKALRILKRRFPGRVRVTVGNSRDTLRRDHIFWRWHWFNCDVISIDGDHSHVGIMADWNHFLLHAAPRAWVLLDDSRQEMAHMQAIAPLVDDLECYVNGNAQSDTFANKTLPASTGFCVARLKHGVAQGRSLVSHDLMQLKYALPLGILLLALIFMLVCWRCS